MIEDRTGDRLALGVECEQFFRGHAAEIGVALHQADRAGLELHRIQFGKHLHELQLIVQIVLEPQDDFGRFNRPPKRGIA
jgi:hypothetical protein